MRDLFKAPSKEQSAQELANHLPIGRVWDLKNDAESNTRKLLRSLAASYNQIEQKIEELHTELNINKTFELLPEWEASVLLPDTCLETLSDLEDRRNLVIERIRRQPIVTIQDFEDTVNVFFPTIGITFLPGLEFFNFEYTLEMTFLGNISEKFILVAVIPLGNNQFEYDLELTLTGGPNTDKLRCFIEEFLPANVYLYITYRG